MPIGTSLTRWERTASPRRSRSSPAGALRGAVETAGAHAPDGELPGPDGFDDLPAPDGFDELPFGDDPFGLPGLDDEDCPLAPPGWEELTDRVEEPEQEPFVELAWNQDAMAAEAQRGNRMAALLAASQARRLLDAATPPGN